jgi:hypothetical protein
MSEEPGWVQLQAEFQFIEAATILVRWSNDGLATEKPATANKKLLNSLPATIPKNSTATDRSKPFP